MEFYLTGKHMGIKGVEFVFQDNFYNGLWQNVVI